MQVLLVGGVENSTPYGHSGTQNIGDFTIINTRLLRSSWVHIQLAERESKTTKTILTSKLP